VSYTSCALVTAAPYVRSRGAKTSLVHATLAFSIYVGSFCVAEAWAGVAWVAAVVGSLIGGAAGGVLFTAQGAYFTLSAVQVYTPLPARATLYAFDVAYREREMQEHSLPLCNSHTAYTWRVLQGWAPQYAHAGEAAAGEGTPSRIEAEQKATSLLAGKTHALTLRNHAPYGKLSGLTGFFLQGSSPRSTCYARCRLSCWRECCRACWEAAGRRVGE
jgi:hypothetical protein